MYFMGCDGVGCGLGGGLVVPKDKEVKIVFNSVLSSTTKFFYDNLEPNAEHIESIDLSHFNSSLLESADSMFSDVLH